MAATTSSFTRFLDLPEEIQDIILIEHFSSISITIRLSTAGPPAVLTQQWLAIVLSAKALYSQSMPIFYRHALFHVSCPPYRPFYWTDCSETPFLLQVRSVSISAEGAWSMILGHMPGQCGPVKLKHIVVKDKFDWNKLWDTFERPTLLLPHVRAYCKANGFIFNAYLHVIAATPPAWQCPHTEQEIKLALDQNGITIYSMRNMDGTFFDKVRTELDLKFRIDLTKPEREYFGRGMEYMNEHVAWEN